MFRTFFEGLVRALFPQRCIFCGGLGVGDCVFCSRCKLDCGKIINCRAIDFNYGDRYFDDCVAMFCYLPPISTAIRAFKFHGKHSHGVVLAQFICDIVQRAYANIQIDCLTFVPETSRKVRHAELLAKHVSKSLDIPLVCGLVKLQENQKQHKLNLQNRMSNVKGVYAVNGQLIEGKRILLIDDVVTTGATLNECSRVLKSSGAAAVLCATVAATGLKPGHREAIPFRASVKPLP
ncbi:MAG: hypothetical protein LBJ38_03845 [Oscillospiraceae bacterium]|jgi:ComF family protein|nr:hypothetical protein [Oscillospiraceae bacterium]